MWLKYGGKRYFYGKVTVKYISTFYALIDVARKVDYALYMRNILDYARELEHKVKYGKCECVLIYLPSGSKIFENAPAAERRT